MGLEVHFATVDPIVYVAFGGVDPRGGVRRGDAHPHRCGFLAHNPPVLAAVPTGKLDANVGRLTT